MPNQELIKEAFQKAKQDIVDLRSQILDLSNQISEIRSLISSVVLSEKQKIPTDTTEFPIIFDETPTLQQKEPTNKLNEIYIPHQKGSKSPNSESSTGNEGVPTDRQTNQQTDKHKNFPNKFAQSSSSLSQEVRLIEVSQALESIDSLKQDLRRKFKSLTKQEMLVFSTVYQMEEEGFTVSYPLLASKLSFSESSARDYALKIIRKGVPLVKTKLGNKKISLSISPELKKIASLQSILLLKEI